MRMGCETVSNAAERSRRMRAAMPPLLKIMKLSVVVMCAVSVLWLGLNPDCMASRWSVMHQLDNFFKIHAG